MKTVAVTFGKEVTPAYLESVRRAGAEPVALQSSADSGRWRKEFARCDALILAGGGDVQPERYGLKLSDAEREKFIRGEDPARDDMELELVKTAVNADMPVLAICRGIQVLNVALGGTLIYDVPACVGQGVEHSATGTKDAMHPVRWEPGSRLVRDLGQGYPEVNSSHHQAVDRAASRLTVIARAPDGVVEAVEDPASKFLVGVQFHPERMWQDDPKFLELFRRFTASI